MTQMMYGLDLTFPRAPPVLHFTPVILETTPQAIVDSLDNSFLSLESQSVEKRVQSLIVAKIEDMCTVAHATQLEISDTGIVYPWAAMFHRTLPPA